MPEPIVIAIPARLGASRLPGKPLLLAAGKPLIAHVIERALAYPGAEVVVATDDERIAEVASQWGVVAVMTSAQHATGSDRLAEVADQLGWADERIVVNLQGDEPLMPISCLDAVIGALRGDSEAAAATLATPVLDVQEWFDSSCVKVVCDRRGRALYFSRAPIPWARDAMAQTRERLPPDPLWRHVGLYAYRGATLRAFARLPKSTLEQAESLEQLRLLENGMAIAVRPAPEPIPPGIDTPADLQRFQASLSANRFSRQPPQP